MLSTHFPDRRGMAIAVHGAGSGAGESLGPLGVGFILAMVMEDDWRLYVVLSVVPALLVGAAVFLWVGGFDIIYACQDADYDRQAPAGLHSIPARWGIPRALQIAALSHLGMLLVLLLLPRSETLGGPALSLGWIYYSGVLAVAILLAYEHRIVRPDDLSRVNLAFFRVNAVVSIGLFLIVTLDLLLN
mgnify:CR=1 FL=1